MRFSVAVSFAVLLAACSGASDEPQGATAVLPDAPDPTPFTRAYSLTESPDGMIRVFAKERRDLTEMFEMRKQADGSWSEPAELELPHVSKLTEPGFGYGDGYLYYSSDAEYPGRPNRANLNIWRVKPTETGWDEPEPLPETINTGASELSASTDLEGRLYFTSSHSRGQGGHDIYEAAPDGEGGWNLQTMPEGFNSARADAQVAVTPDGSRMFFYTHREPKMGVVDIWTAVRGEDGSWQMPVNLGGPVNTPGIDLGPGVSGDGDTFFFSREGRLMQIPMDEALAGEGWDGSEDDADAES